MALSPANRPGASASSWYWLDCCCCLPYFVWSTAISLHQVASGEWQPVLTSN